MDNDAVLFYVLLVYKIDLVDVIYVILGQSY